MIKRIMIFGVLSSLIQAALYYLLVIVLWNVGKKFHTPVKTDFTWGLTILYSTYMFGIITLIQNSLNEISQKKTIVIYLFIGSIITFILAIQNFAYWPFKTLILVVSGLIILLIKLSLDYNFSNLKSKIVNQQSKIKCSYE